MPRKSAKDTIVEELIDNFAQETICNEEILSDDDTIEEDLDELEENIAIVMSCRRGVSDPIPTSSTWRNNILTNMDDNRFKQMLRDDNRFKQMLRVDRNQFSKIVSLIKDAEVFNRPHSCKQYSVELQLAVVLFRLGSSGEGGTFRKIGSIFEIGDGGTISAFTNRIFKVLLTLQSKYISWPSETERLEIVSDTFDELPFCIGYIDGTEIKLQK